MVCHPVRCAVVCDPLGRREARLERIGLNGLFHRFLQGVVIGSVGHMANDEFLQGSFAFCGLV